MLFARSFILASTMHGVFKHSLFCIQCAFFRDDSTDHAGFRDEKFLKNLTRTDVSSLIKT